MVKIGDIQNFRDKLEKARYMIELENKIVLDDVLAQNIIEHLRIGVAPVIGTALFSSGREQLISDLHKDLKVVAEGASTLQILNGAYGTGKSFTLRMLQDFSFQQNFATSYVTLTRRECPLNDMSSIYRYIVKGLRVSECQDRPALEYVLERWAENVRESIGSKLKPPWSFLKISESYKEVLSLYFESYYRNNIVGCERALAWLTGDMIQVTEMKKLRLTTTVNSANALKMLGDLTCIIRQIGYNGLVILLDEAEQIPSFYFQEYKIEACNNLILLANCYRETPFSFFIYATTPHFLEFLKTSREWRYTLKYQKLVELHNLNAKEYTTLSIYIREIYAKAYGNSSKFISERDLRWYVSELLRLYLSSINPRIFVKCIVELLDSYSEDKEIDLNHLVNTQIKLLE
jgi:P-loop Domain of unknown function (DUF2791)